MAKKQPQYYITKYIQYDIYISQEVTGILGTKIGGGIVPWESNQMWVQHFLLTEKSTKTQRAKFFNWGIR